jgi:hypothetical protein
LLKLKLHSKLVSVLEIGQRKPNRGRAAEAGFRKKRATNAALTNNRFGQAI